MLLYWEVAKASRLRVSRRLVACGAGWAVHDILLIAKGRCWVGSSSAACTPQVHPLVSFYPCPAVMLPFVAHVPILIMMILTCKTVDTDADEFCLSSICYDAPACAVQLSAHPNHPFCAKWKRMLTGESVQNIFSRFSWIYWLPKYADRTTE